MDACKKVFKTKECGYKEIYDNGLQLLSVNGAMFSLKNDMYLSINSNQISFNVACLEKLNVENIEMFLHPIDKRLIVLPANHGGREYSWGHREADVYG